MLAAGKECMKQSRKKRNSDKIKSCNSGMFYSSERLSRQNGFLGHPL